MKWIIASQIILVALVVTGCSRELQAKSDSWEGWSNEAAFLAKHVDEQAGVVCYLSTRGGQASSRDNPLSCVKL